MTYEEYLELKKRSAWLKNQQNWHKRRLGAWHKNQSSYYKRQGNKIWKTVDFTSIVMFTFRQHSSKIVENVVRNNPLFETIKERKSHATNT